MTSIGYWCLNCGSEEGPVSSFMATGECPACADKRMALYFTAERFRGACLAMSRFLVFVWMEARYQWEEAHGHPLALRTWPFLTALESGRLKLVWP